jgi:anti-sigma B factor antagonist
MVGRRFGPSRGGAEASRAASEVSVVSDAVVGDPFGTGLPIDTVVSRPRPYVVLLAVDGELDTLTAPRLAADLNAALEVALDEGAAVVVDLSDVMFLASSGLAVLVDGARRAGAAAQRLHLVTASRAVSRPLEVTGADTLFDTHADVGSALAAIAPPAVAPPRAE